MPLGPPPLLFSVVLFGLSPRFGKLLNIQKLCEPACARFHGGGGSGCGRAPPLKEMGFPRCDTDPSLLLLRPRPKSTAKQTAEVKK